MDEDIKIQFLNMDSKEEKNLNKIYLKILESTKNKYYCPELKRGFKNQAAIAKFFEISRTAVANAIKRRAKIQSTYSFVKVRSK